jgi:hypothetical protein
MCIGFSWQRNRHTEIYIQRYTVREGTEITRDWWIRVNGCTDLWRFFEELIESLGVCWYRLREVWIQEQQGRSYTGSLVYSIMLWPGREPGFLQWPGGWWFRSGAGWWCWWCSLCRRTCFRRLARGWGSCVVLQASLVVIHGGRRYCHYLGCGLRALGRRGKPFSMLLCAQLLLLLLPSVSCVFFIILSTIIYFALPSFGSAACVTVPVDFGIVQFPVTENVAVVWEFQVSVAVVRDSAVTWMLPTLNFRIAMACLEAWMISS